MNRNPITFADRDEAGWMLVERLRGEALEKPLVLAIPRGGVEIGAVLARGLGAELDVVLSRKLRAPHQPELALGAVSESGEVYLNHFASAMTDAGDAYVEAERQRQLAEIERRRALIRAVRPQAPIAGRTVIVTDDGVAMAGFPHVVHNGMILAPDDYCPAGNLFAVNTNHLGFAIHQNGFFARQPWVDLAGPAGRSMKILWHGNLICSNRKAHACHANLS